MKTNKIALTLFLGTLVMLAPVTVLANGTVDLAVFKNDDLTVGQKNPGDTIFYSITFFNNGSISARGTELSEIVPAYTTFDPFQSDIPWSCSPDNSAGSVCKRSLNGVGVGGPYGPIKFAVKIDPVLPCNITAIKNTITISSDEVDAFPADNLSNEQTPIDPGSNCGSWPLESTKCEMTKHYYMYALEDANQPPQWQGYCYIISSNGYPSTQIQAKLCTPPGFDHTFRATNIPYGGWVSTDCHGVAHYGWPHWDPSWYRPDKAK